MANSYLGGRSPKGNVGVRGVIDSGELSAYSQGVLSGFAAASVTASWTLNMGGQAGIQDVLVVKNPGGESDLLVGTAGQAIQFTIGSAPSTPGQSRTDALVAYKNPSTTSVVNDGIDAVDYMVVAGTPATTGTQVPPSASTIRTAVGALHFIGVIGYVTVAQGASAVTTGNYYKNPALLSTQVVANDTARGLITPVEGMEVYQLDDDATYIYNGTAWLAFDTKWQTYTPDVYTNNVLWTKGNGTASGRYFRTGKRLDLEFLIGLGSTTAWNSSGTHEITIPSGLTIATSLNANQCPKGQGRSLKSGVGEALTTIQCSNSNPTTRISMWSNQYITTNQGNQPIGATSPFTSADGDVHIGFCTLPLA